MEETQQLRQQEDAATQFVMSLPEPHHWYAAHIRSQHEKKAAAILQERGIDTFLPLVTQIHQWSDRHKQVQIPLFPCYTFIHVIRSVETRLLILKTPGVLGIVGSPGVGTPIPDKEIEGIQALLANGVSCTFHPFLRIGQRVRIHGGCLDGIEGIILAQNTHRRLVLSIEQIQQAVVINISGYDVEPI